MINNFFRKINVKFAIYFCFIASSIIIFLLILEFFNVIPFGVIWTGEEVINGTYHFGSSRFYRILELRDLAFRINVMVFIISTLNTNFFKSSNFSISNNDRSSLIFLLAFNSFLTSMIIADYIDMELLNNITPILHIFVQILHLVCIYRILLDRPRVEDKQLL